jgi:hypothetical protein
MIAVKVLWSSWTGDSHNFWATCSGFFSALNGSDLRLTASCVVYTYGLVKSEMQVDSFEATEGLQLLHEATARTGELQKASIGDI